MVSFVILCSFLSLFIICGGDEMLGPGKWSIIGIERCEEDDMYKTDMDVVTRRVNRTHVAFSFTVHFDQQVDELVAIRIEICKFVDGGCKAYQTLMDESLIHFGEKYAKKNVESAFGLTTLDGYPIPAGDLTINDYIFDLQELPDESVYGEFTGKGYLIKNGAEFACVKVTAKFEKCDDDDD